MPAACEGLWKWESGKASRVQLLQAVSYHRRMWIGESYPTGMYFTMAPTVRLRSESCPLGSRNRAVARTVTMELPSTRRRFAPAPMDCAKSPSCCCVRSEEHTAELQSLRHLVCRL